MLAGHPSVSEGSFEALTDSVALHGSILEELKHRGYVNEARFCWAVRTSELLDQLAEDIFEAGSPLVHQLNINPAAFQLSHHMGSLHLVCGACVRPHGRNKGQPTLTHEKAAIGAAGQPSTRPPQ